jgi:adenylosuccinate synthase
MSSESRDKLLSNVKTLAIVCNQWGDTGKGKFVDYFAEWADIIARGTGGANAGHTIIIGDKEYIFHLVPSGILYDKEGKVNIIGTGAAIDPRVVSEELDILKREGLTFQNLKISKDAKLVMPQHLLVDRAKERSLEGKIGTTGRGIGPAYVDHYDRVGLRVNDILNPSLFREKLKKNIEGKMLMLRSIDKAVLKEIMQHEHLGNGKFYDDANVFNFEALLEAYLEYGKLLHSMIADTDKIVRDAKGVKNILLEGAQGNLLSVDIGTYPFVTASDCSVRGLAKGVGLTDSDVDLTLGIVKAPYMTRVGEGPFPTELGGEKSAKWCGTKGITKQTEKEQYPDASTEDTDEFIQGIALRKAGGEYGATTGRPRRTGWLDLPILKYSMITSGSHVILTKIDVLDAVKEIKICHAYTYNGPDYVSGEKTLKTGDIIDTAIIESEVLSHCSPLYTTFPGWLEKTSDKLSYEELPEKLKTILNFIKEKTGAVIDIVSIGPDRDQTIILR